MIRRPYSFLFFIVSGIFITSELFAVNVFISEHNKQVTIENSQVLVKVDLTRGIYTAFDKKGKIEALQSPWRINEFSSDDSGVIHEWRQGETIGVMGTGKHLLISSAKEGRPETLFRIALYENTAAVVLTLGLKNTTGEPFQLKTFEPLYNAHTYKTLDIGENFIMLEGNGGGDQTRVLRNNRMSSLNNALLTFGTGKSRRSLVLGGLTYRDFLKTVEAKDPASNTRKDELAAKMGSEQPLVAYLDLPASEAKSTDGPSMELTLGTRTNMSFHIPQAFNINEVSSLVYDAKHVLVDVKNLDPAKLYQIGFSWWDEGSGRLQSVYAEAGHERTLLLDKRSLPSWENGQNKPEQIMLTLPQETYKSGAVTLSFSNEAKKRNAVVSEVWLREIKAPLPKVIEEIDISRNTVPKKLNVTLAASDPVGKRVDPLITYLPESDSFYIDFITSNPFESLESYGFALKRCQNANPNIYDFPSVCLWYAMFHRYGAGPAVNSSTGAVEEMQRIADSGFLKYSRAAVRLVPDTYTPNNQQGWWDDEHWQMYGTESYMYAPDDPRPIELPKHYNKPYETTKKWASAVRGLGGIPLIYVQTGFRSDDYAITHPEHLLFNKSLSIKVDNSGKPFKYDPNTMGAHKRGEILHSYDYTDPDFQKHLREVYYNLRRGGVRGLMFDYPNTGWAEQGGMEDIYSTAGAAYRNIFLFAKEGLGPDSFVHERNLIKGSDITLGLVDSQRTWGDTDLINPEMVSRSGLRWYKNRVVVSYDMDSKNILKTEPDNRDGQRCMLTMSYVAASRLLLGTSFGKLTKEHLYDLSRVFPYHTNPQSARPIDAFVSEYPSVYDFAVHSDWHQITLYNSDIANSKQFSVSLSGDVVQGAIGLDADEQYYIYDFWNDNFVGVLKGSDKLKQTLRPGEARMLSVHKKVNHPQFIATDRHLMQGYIDIIDINWNQDKKQLQGICSVVEDEPYRLTIATNGFKPVSCRAGDSKCSINVRNDNTSIADLVVESSITGPVEWTAEFKK